MNEHQLPTIANPEAVRLVNAIYLLGGEEIRLPVASNDFEGLANHMPLLCRLVERMSKRAVRKLDELINANANAKRFAEHFGREHAAQWCRLCDEINEQNKIIAELRARLSLSCSNSNSSEAK